MSDYEKGLRRLADEIASDCGVSTLRLGGGTRISNIDDLLRRELLPLLEAAHDETELHLRGDCDDSSLCPRCKLKELVTKWTK